MSEFKLDLADLEIEAIVADANEQNDLRAVTTGDVGHGMSEVGASCCSMDPSFPGSCAASKDEEFV